MIDLAEKLTKNDYQMAFSEVAFLVENFANTIDAVMGGAISPVGRIAGREMARKIPLHFEDRSIENVITILSERMQAGYKISIHEKSDQSTQIAISTCAIRDVCSIRHCPHGGAMCKLFHAYFDGIVNELIYRPVKSDILKTGETCMISMRIQ